MKKLLVFLCTMSLVFSIVGVVEAIPPLGVAPTSGGTYYGPSEDYLDYFYEFNVDPFSGDPGFSMPSSGGSLTVWFGFNQGFYFGDYDIDIYLATDSLAGLGFKFNELPFSQVDANKKIASYKDVNGSQSGNQYYSVRLGSINNPVLTSFNQDGWVRAEDSPWGDNNREYYFYTGIIDYTDFVVAEDWMFAYADIAGTIPGVFDNGEDAFSPKTASSSYPVPEPATMLLFGSGLIGLAVVGRKKFRKIQK